MPMISQAYLKGRPNLPFSEGVCISLLRLSVSQANSILLLAYYGLFTDASFRSVSFQTFFIHDMDTGNKQRGTYKHTEI